jgi:hypothetical protein
MHGKKKNCIKGFGEEKKKERDHVEDLSIDTRFTLKLISRKQA